MSRLRFTFIVAIGLAVPALVTATYWSPPINVYPQNSYDEWTASLSIDRNGVPWVVWGVSPRYSRWDGSDWEPAQRVCPTGDGLNHRWPKMACGLDGSLWVLWEADLSYSWFFGMASRWNGLGWSPPDTLWIENTPSATSYGLAPVSGNEAWFIRNAYYKTRQVEAIHLVDGSITSYMLGNPDFGNGDPSIAVDPEGVIWATWIQSSADPYNFTTTIAYSRFMNGVWEPPEFASGPVLINRYGLVAAVDDTKWIVSHEQDPRFGLLENTFARRWTGTGWGEPQMISDPIGTGDTIQGQLSVNRNCDGYPTATWIRGGATAVRRDVLVSRWDGTQWTRPIMGGRLVDADFANWPAAAATDTSIWVAYQRPVPPSWVTNILATHTIHFQSLEGLAAFSADPLPPGAKLSWSMSELVASVEVRVHRFPGDVASGQGTPPLGSEVVADISGARARKGVTVDQVRTPGTYAYWLEILQADGTSGWVGPRTVEILGDKRATQAGSVALQSRVFQGQHVEFWAAIPFRNGLRVSIYDVQGTLVRVLSIRQHDASPTVQFRWDGRRQSGDTVASGVYFARLEGNEEQHVGVAKVVWVR